MPTREVAAERRRYGVEAGPTTLTRATQATTGAIGNVVERRDVGRSWAYSLDRAGIRRTVPEFILLIGATALVALALGTLVSSIFAGILLALVVAGGSVMFVAFRSDRRKAQFADQLDDMTQLLASNMRAGHSLLQSIDSLSKELEEPATSEMVRVVNQVRVGRDLGDALAETAERMDSADFLWISQAIAIHRQVGGNLADVLDQVGVTIRERNAIRRQVKALSAEGKLSAYVLVALPFLVALVLSLLNPAYMGRLTESALGYAMLGVAVVLLFIGSLWLRKTVQIEF
ncbi:type II secretion system F family protein [Ornithinimicrobium sediminis]|uniref:type II secretion system F family protein n=1 Tax=Ornithinimicrobium sediminis TaxID=2904603 RepID=UPI001E65AAA0|nr:type II secretion system F family protein [Ornithinimicrobium sediminis]